MSCPYAANSFCSAFSKELLGDLCACCRIKRYPQGQWLSHAYFKNDFVFLTEGLMVYTLPGDCSQKATTCGMISGGALIRADMVLHITPTLEEAYDILCMKECAAAFWDVDVVSQLYRQSESFRETVINTCFQTCTFEVGQMMKEVGGGSAYSAVRYVVKFCRDHGISQLTHDQIAMICNRSRPTTTNALHQLIKNEPELFIAPDALPQQPAN